MNVRRPPLEVPESDHNLVYAKIRISRRPETNRRKDSTKETNSEDGRPQAVDADPNLRCQVAKFRTCINDVATDMADVILSTAAELASARAEHRVGARVLVWRLR